MSTNDTHFTSSFQSTYALEQLKRFARASNELLFSQVLLPVFDANIPVARLEALRAALADDTVTNPAFNMVDQCESVAVYDYQRRVIDVDTGAIEKALAQPETTPTLLIALIEAFALHIDNLLRNDLADNTQADTAAVLLEAPEGLATHYAAMLTYFDQIPGDGVSFAHYTSAAYDGPIQLTLPALEAAPDEPERGTRHKRFAAEIEDHGDATHAHETIEKVALTRVGFTAEQCQAIYFGNWLRDHSQLIDPKIVRAPGAEAKFPAMFTRQTLTKLVDFLALKKFHALQNTPQGREAYTVTPALLGVYRPSEHIDNPINLDEAAIDPRTIDPEFEALVRRDNPLNVPHPKYSVMMYFKTSLRYMSKKLDAAKAEGKTATGMRNLGEALHVLEDLFAHSNYVELCLRKIGHADVAAWSTDLIGAKHPCPVVTGRFSGLDVIGSVAEPLARILFPTNSLAFRPIEAGERSDNEQALSILLEGSDYPEMKEAYELTLRQRDIAARNPLLRLVQGVRWARDLPLNSVNFAKNWLMQKLATWAGDSIGPLQTAFNSDPNTDSEAIVSHSQLAKDHATHPLHELAALLAQDAVERVARAMKEAWEGNAQRQPAYLASSYFSHPGDNTWYEKMARDWAAANPEKIEEACNPTRLIQRRQQEMQASLDRLKKLGNDDNYALQHYYETLSIAFPL
ncbi:Heterokaryon incompatibility protein Het-C [Pseudomonas sp. IsoF]|uniref:Het-C domain-containing protein n=1 Tax=Pseudomonas sp. IsoF TaxID=2821559 RepID=UPI002058DE28|nr:Het-C domain-containing protein [Pseudomonas sp. IsoF]UPL04990.1 Heterokaryon incompatibility protein Het-C [Pseudomonas sp. IsoF]